MTHKVMEILKSDERANRMIEKFHNTAIEKGLTGTSYKEARKTMLMMIIATTPAARNAMADEIYDEINGVEAS